MTCAAASRPASARSRRRTTTGRWNVSLHHPAVGEGSWELTKAVNAIGALPANVKEVVILVVGGHHWTAYEIYAHVAVAERAGMP